MSTDDDSDFDLEEFLKGGIAISQATTAADRPAAAAIAAVLSEVAGLEGEGAEGFRQIGLKVSPKAMRILGDYVSHLRQLAGVPLAIVTIQDVNRVRALPEEKRLAALRVLLGEGEGVPRFSSENEELVLSKIGFSPSAACTLKELTYSPEGRRDFCERGILFFDAPLASGKGFKKLVARLMSVPETAVERLPGTPVIWLRHFMVHEAGHVRQVNARDPDHGWSRVPVNEGISDDFANALAVPAGASPRQKAAHHRVAQAMRQLRSVEQILIPRSFAYVSTLGAVLPQEEGKSLPIPSPLALKDAVREVQVALDRELGIAPPLLSLEAVTELCAEPFTSPLFRSLRSYLLSRPDEISDLSRNQLAGLLEDKLEGESSSSLAERALRQPAVLDYLRDYLRSSSRTKDLGASYAAVQRLLQQEAYAAPSPARRLLTEFVGGVECFCPSLARANRAPGSKPTPRLPPLRMS